MIAKRETRVFQWERDKVMVELSFDTHGALVDVAVKSKFQETQGPGDIVLWSRKWPEVFYERHTATFWGKDVP